MSLRRSTRSVTRPWYSAACKIWEESVGQAEPQPGAVLLGELVPELSPAERTRVDAAVDRLAAVLGGAPRVTVLEMAIEPGLDPIPDPDGSGRLRPAVTMGIPIADGSRDVVTYVARPELLAHYGLAADAFDPDTDVLTVRTDELRFTALERKTDPEVATRVEALDVPSYSSAPTTLLTEQALARRGWKTAPAGWFVEASQPLTSQQQAAAREVAAGAGLTIETRDDQGSLAVTRSTATAAGMLLALGVLAMSVGLIRGEATADLRTLTASGASSRVRRALTAATAGGLALAGVTLGTAGAYLGFVAGNLTDLSALSSVPVLHLTVIGVGVPAVATVVGALLAGREPPALARAALV
ncbi:MAG: hypothetical protein GEV12_14180 [Micromonosporaceae bacterium]|nr:hypothetical protein [Micromonosporaceae bacterium]